MGDEARKRSWEWNGWVHTSGRWRSSSRSTFWLLMSKSHSLERGDKIFGFLGSKRGFEQNGCCKTLRGRLFRATTAGWAACHEETRGIRGGHGSIPIPLYTRQTATRHHTTTPPKPASTSSRKKKKQNFATKGKTLQRPVMSPSHQSSRVTNSTQYPDAQKEKIKKKRLRIATGAKDSRGGLASTGRAGARARIRAEARKNGKKAIIIISAQLQMRRRRCGGASVKQAPVQILKVLPCFQ